MRRPFPLILLFAAALCLVPAVASAAAPTPAPSPSGASIGPGEAPAAFDIVKVNGVIDRPMADYLLGALADAESRDAGVIIQLNTPGSLGIDGEALAQRIFEAKVPVIVWIGPAPAHAMGTGLMLVYASSYAVVAPLAGTGPILPLDLAHDAEIIPGTPLPPALARSLPTNRWAAARDRDPTFAAENVEAPGQVVLDRHVVQDFAGSSAELLKKLDGVTVPTAAGDVTLRTADKDTKLTFHDLGIGRRILHAVSSPVTIYVLIVLGMMGLVFELTQAGVGVAGIAGAIALGFAIYGLVIVPFSPLGLALLVGGLIAMTFDVVLKRLGWLTFLGMAAFVAGSYLVFHDVAPAIDISPWLIWPAAVVVFLYFGFGMTVAQQSRERIVNTQRGLVGLQGEARGMLAPEGPVYVKGTMWRGRALDGPIPPGTKVRVRRVDGLILRVEPEPGASETGAETGPEEPPE
jgi:membrane-bound serine protease (ClpP class)